MIDQKKLNKVYKKYKSTTNMCYSTLLRWNKTKLSKKASLNRKPIKNNLRLLRKKKHQWTKLDIKNANKTISFLSRSKKIPRNKRINRKTYTKNEIALKNWGFDVKRKDNKIYKQ